MIGPAQPVQPTTAAVKQLSLEDQRALDAACKRIAANATGRMIKDPVSGFWVPEQMQPRLRFVAGPLPEESAK